MSAINQPLRETSSQKEPLVNYAIIGLAFLLSLVSRLLLFDFESNDYLGFNGPWYDYLINHGRFKALADEFSNYPPLYLYFLSLATYLPLPNLYAIKIVHMTFDYIMAAYVYKIVRVKYPNGLLPTAAFFAVLFLPTVAFNSSLWGQCDAMYASGIVACLYYLLVQKPWHAAVAFGIAFSFKPQAVFFIPVLFILLMNGQLKLLHLAIIPWVYLLLTIPALIAGRPLGQILLLYADDKNYPTFNMGATNLYQWLPIASSEAIYKAALLLTGTASLLFILFAHRFGKGRCNIDFPVKTSLASVILVPFLLPSMHERYFFSADVLAVIYAFYVPRHFYVAYLVQATSFFNYLPYLFNQQPFSRPLLAFVLLFAMAIVLRDVFAGEREKARFIL